MGMANILVKGKEEKASNLLLSAIVKKSIKLTKSQEEAFKTELVYYKGKGKEAFSNAKNNLLKYLSWVKSAAGTISLQSGKAKKPPNEEQALQLAKNALEIIWSNFTYSNESHMIIQSMGIGKLDCDSSSLALADVLISLGVDESRISLVFLPRHVLLKLDGNYIETTTGESQPHEFYIYDEEGFRKEYKKVYAILPHAKARLLMALSSRAEMLLEDKKYPQSIRDYTAFAKSVGSKDAYMNISLCYFGLQEFEKSLEYINKAISIDAKNPKFYELRSKVYMFLSLRGNSGKQLEYRELSRSDKINAEQLMLEEMKERQNSK